MKIELWHLIQKIINETIWWVRFAGIVKLNFGLITQHNNIVVERIIHPVTMTG